MQTKALTKASQEVPDRPPKKSVIKTCIIIILQASVESEIYSKQQTFGIVMLTGPYSRYNIKEAKLM